MTITALPTPPSTTDVVNFDARADAFMAALPTFVTEANALAVAMNLNSTTDTSATSNTIEYGSKNFTVSTGKSFQPGMYLIIADTAAPSTNSMYGQITSYNSGTGALIIQVRNIIGSGTKTAWIISQASVGISSKLRNFITNGSCEVATAGTSFPNCLGTYTLVGWYVHGNGNITVTQIAQPRSNSASGYSIQLARTTGDTNVLYIGLAHSIKTVDSIEMAGKTVTLAFNAFHGANFSAAGNILTGRIVYGTGTDENSTSFTGSAIASSTNFTLSTTSTTFSASASIPDTATEVGIWFTYIPTGTAGAADHVNISDIQLRIEDGFSTLDLTPSELNRQACLELCESSFNYGVVPVQNAGTNTGENRLIAQYAGASINYFYIPFKHKKRNSSYTITLYNPAATNAQIRDIAGTVDFSSSSATANGINGFNISATGNAATAVFNRCGVHWLVRNEQ